MEHVDLLSTHRLGLRASMHVQRGAVMIVALIFLLLLTILAVSASGNSLLQERMAGGLRNAQQAQMAAETALRGAEWKLWSSSGTSGRMQCGATVPAACYVFDGANPIAAVVDFRTKPGWITAGATTYQGVDGTLDYTTLDHGRLAKNPLYIIEDMGPERPPGVMGGLHESGATSANRIDSPAAHIYRITARASGGNANTVRVVESTFSSKLY